MSGTLGLASVILKTWSSLRFRRVQRRDLQQSRSFRLFIAMCSIWNDRIAKSRDSLNKGASKSTERKFATQRPQLPLNRARLYASIENTQCECAKSMGARSAA